MHGPKPPKFGRGEETVMAIVWTVLSILFALFIVYLILDK